MVELRDVTENDIQKIYDWRNHPKIRVCMFNSGEIKLEDHITYLKNRLNNPEEYSFMILDENKEMGVVKLDKRENSYEVGILLDPEMHGKGIGTQSIEAIIKKAKELGIKKLTSRVKEWNVGSKKIFEKNNFKEVDDHYELEVSL